MEIQERADSDDENMEEDVETENTEKRLYNGFQGPLTETEESSLQPNISSGSSGSTSDTVLRSGALLLVLFLLIWRCSDGARTQCNVICAKSTRASLPNAECRLYHKNCHSKC